MKNILISTCLLLGLVAMQPALAEAEVKEVCKDKVDKAGNPVKDKDGKVKQECKKIKVHKKFEGTEIPPDKKK